jgi:hypothetical protein
MLKIRQVQESDRGCYMCQINTEEMKKQIGCIDVLSKYTLKSRSGWLSGLRRCLAFHAGGPGSITAVPARPVISVEKVLSYFL